MLQRAFELTFFGKFQHDLKLFEMYNAQIDLMRAVDAALPARSPLRVIRPSCACAITVGSIG